MNHTIRQQKMFDHIPAKQRVSVEPSILEEILKLIGGVLIGVCSGVVIVFCVWMLWVSSKGYLDYFAMRWF